jgi:hypothetical protein
MNVAKRRFTVRTGIAVDRVAWIGLAFCLAVAGQSLAAGGDSRARLVSPVANQSFAPGDTVNVVVRATVPLAAAYAGVGLRGVGVLELTRDPDAVTDRSRFVIPDDFAGWSNLTISAIDSNANPFNGGVVTIVVRPTTRTRSLSPVQAERHLNSEGEKARLYVTGNYAGGMTRDLSSSATGTVYASSDPRIIRVDAEGKVEAVGLGAASVSATNGGQKTLFTFSVEDPGHLLPPQDWRRRYDLRHRPSRWTQRSRRGNRRPSTRKRSPSPTRPVHRRSDGSIGLCWICRRNGGHWDSRQVEWCITFASSEGRPDAGPWGARGGNTHAHRVTVPDRTRLSPWRHSIPWRHRPAQIRRLRTTPVTA